VGLIPVLPWPVTAAENLLSALFSPSASRLGFSVTVRNDIAPDKGKKYCASTTRSVGSYVGTLNGVVPFLQRSTLRLYESTCCGSLSVWRSLGAVSISDYDPEYCVNHDKSRIEFTPEFVRALMPRDLHEQKVLKAA
jgi:hypothetical protein